MVRSSLFKQFMDRYLSRKEIAYRLPVSNAYLLILAWDGESAKEERYIFAAQGAECASFLVCRQKGQKHNATQ